MYTTDLVCIGRAELPRSAWPKWSVLDMNRDVFTVLTTVGSQAHYSKQEQGSWVTGAGLGNWRLLPSHLSSHGASVRECLGSPGVRCRSLCLCFFIPSLQTQLLAHPSQDQNHWWWPHRCHPVCRQGQWRLKSREATPQIEEAAGSFGIRFNGESVLPQPGLKSCCCNNWPHVLCPGDYKSLHVTVLSLLQVSH